MKKSDAKRIAQRYVKALFEVSVQARAVDAVEKDLNALGAVIAQSKEFQHFLTNPLLSNGERGEVMLALLAKLDVNQVSRQFIGMLIAQKRLSILPEVISLFSIWAENSRGEMRAELISASELKSSEVDMVGQRLGKAYGKKMKLTVRQNKALLGGVVVKIGSLELDSSVAGKLNRLNKTLRVA